jgi:hypothetical protein
VIYTEKGGSAKPHCSGPGRADPGYLCIYGAFGFDVGEPEVFNYAGGSFTQGASAVGFDLEWPTNHSDSYEAGTWTVTAE